MEAKGLLAIFGSLWILGILLYILVLYLLVFWILIPALHIIAPMFGFPG